MQVEWHKARAVATTWLRTGEAGRGFWSLADQGAVSLGTFLSSILLARRLSLEEYGTYALLFGVMLFLNGLHNALVAYPLSVAGAPLGRAELGRLSGVALLFTAVLLIPLGFGIGAAAGIAGPVRIVPLVVVALVCWQFQETTRRALMAHLHHRTALIGDSMSYLGQALLYWILAQAGELSLRTAFVAMAATFALGGLVQVVQLGVGVHQWQSLRHWAGRFWGLGRWIMLAGLAGVLTVQAFPWTLAAFWGTAEVARYQAAANLLGVCHPILLGLSNLVVPAAARAFADGGPVASWRAALRFGLPAGALLAPFWLLLLVWPEPVLQLFYGEHSPYATLGPAVRLFALAYVFVYAAQVVGGYLSGMGQSRSAFRMQATSGISAACIGLPVAALFGVLGACAGLVITHAVRATAGGFLAIRQKPVHDSEVAPV